MTLGRHVSSYLPSGTRNGNVSEISFSTMNASIRKRRAISALILLPVLSLMKVSCLCLPLASFAKSVTAHQCCQQNKKSDPATDHHQHRMCLHCGEAKVLPAESTTQAASKVLTIRPEWVFFVTGEPTKITPSTRCHFSHNRAPPSRLEPHNSTCVLLI